MEAEGVPSLSLAINGAVESCQTYKWFNQVCVITVCTVSLIEKKAKSKTVMVFRKIFFLTESKLAGLSDSIVGSLFKYRNASMLVFVL